MEDVTLAHAKQHLEELIERAARGEDVRISDSKGASVRLVAAERDRAGRVTFGYWKHLGEIPKERLLAPLDDEELDWLSGEHTAGE